MTLDIAGFRLDVPPDERTLRRVLGCFLTGVTVVTTHTAEGEPRGFTANSFTPVSLDPPLVLVCVGRHVGSLPVFREAPSFAVNILSADQQLTSNVFASRRDDKFERVAWRRSSLGNPLLRDTAAWIDCQVHDRIQAGDHLVLLGRVTAIGQDDQPPLGYHRGGYVRLRPEP